MSASIELGPWDAMRELAQPVRYQVFVIEQKVPLELEWDDMDAASLHAIARGADGSIIATGRLLPDGHIGRMAVLQEHRGKGIGGALLHALMERARARGDASVLLNAQVQAQDFYARHGFAPEGPTFMEAGIPHVCMRHVFAR